MMVEYMYVNVIDIKSRFSGNVRVNKVGKKCDRPSKIFFALGA